MINSRHFERKLRPKGGLAKRMTLFMVPVFIFASLSVSPVDAILNCFNPNMFKMNKGGIQQPYGPDRAHWYPQSHLPYQPNYYGQMGGLGHHMNPMKLLFQPKWGGGSMFGPKGWNSWKMGANSNFYRPGYGYGAAMTGGPSGSYHLSDQLNIAPFSMPPSIGSYPTNPNEGWSAPVAYSPPPIQQTQLNNYDSYAQQPTFQPSKQQLAPLVDVYGTKGITSGNKYTSTTKNSILQATGYGLYDEPATKLINRTYGYAYPDWYSGFVESPAKIAQQLMRYGLKRPQHQNRSAPLIQDSSGVTTQMPSNSQFTILDEPRFVGYGIVDSLSNKEARLSCSFNEAIDQTNRPVWVKFLGPYNSSRIINAKVVPPFNCASSQCRTQEIESTKDYRYRFDNGPATSTLVISEPRLSDYGTYRCSALTKAINNNPLETIYQIVQLGIL